MADELKGLIEKIQQEGVREAEHKARIIDEEARQRAGDIVNKAEEEARGIVARAKEESARIDVSGRVSLAQAGRDLILTLKKEMSAILDRLITAEVRQALTPEELARIITLLVKDRKTDDKDAIVLSLSKDDTDKIGENFLAKLKGEIKEGVVLKAADDIKGGFVISFDSGRSHFDFSDKALAEYLGAHIKGRLAEILKETAAGDKK